MHTFRSDRRVAPTSYGLLLFGHKKSNLRTDVPLSVPSQQCPYCLSGRQHTPLRLLLHVQICVLVMYGYSSVGSMHSVRSMVNCILHYIQCTPPFSVQHLFYLDLDITSNAVTLVIKKKHICLSGWWTLNLEQASPTHAILCLALYRCLYSLCVRLVCLCPPLSLDRRSRITRAGPPHQRRC